MPELKVNGQTAYFQNGGVEWREGRPSVVFVHGAGMDHTVWQQQSRALAHHGCNVAALDLPGHGESGDVAGIGTMADYTAWLLAFLDAAGWERAVVVGQSLGASIAVELAAQHPERCAGLVLIGVGLEMKVHPELLDDTLNNKPRAEDFIIAYTHAPATRLGGAPTPGNWMLGSATALLRACGETVLHRDFQVCHEWNGGAFAEKIQCPTLVVNGNRDRMTLLRTVKTLTETIKNARLEVLDGIGHMVQTEAPRQFLKLLRNFISTRVGE
ncbi:MAG: alpha/beta hydrolase [bacterium]